VVQRNNVFGKNISVSQERSATLPPLNLIPNLRGPEQDLFLPRIIDCLVDIFEKIFLRLHLSRAYIILYFRKRNINLFKRRKPWPQ
jgi:hypothetical protein